jgi:hypothetical protein
MSENHKRLLDQIRMRGDHPAATYADLPEEAQGYVNRLELEIYDSKQQRLAQSSLFLCAVGIYLLYQWYKSDDMSYLVFGLILSIAPWIYYRFRWKQNADEFIPKANPTRSADEAMQEEWDINYLSGVRQTERDA